MGQRGRQSGASLSVIAGTAIDGRPAAPPGMTEFQVEVWTRTVGNEAADVFRTAALQQLLADYCRHVESAHRLTVQIDRHLATECSNIELDDLDRLMKMRERETRALADKATKLRLTNQSRYTPKAAGTAAKNAQTERKPWQLTG
jgi:hypothetical protein